MAGHLFFRSTDCNAFTFFCGVVKRQVTGIARLKVKFIFFSKRIAECLFTAHHLDFTAKTKFIWPFVLFFPYNSCADIRKCCCTHGKHHRCCCRKCNHFFHLCFPPMNSLMSDPTAVFFPWTFLHLFYVCRYYKRYLCFLQ